MPPRPPKDPVASYFGARGGRVRVPKGLSKLSAEDRKRIARAGVLARQRKREKPPIGTGTETFLAAWAVQLPEQDHMTDSIEVEHHARRNGSATIARTYKGLRVQAGHKVREIMVRESARRQSNGKPAPHSYHVTEAPPAPYTFTSRPSEEWREHRFTFAPAWSGDGHLSFRIESTLPEAYECEAGEGVTAFRVAHACRLLSLVVKVDPAPKCGTLTWLEPFAFLDDPSQPSALANVSRDSSVRHENHEARLFVVDPLPHYHFALRWRVGSVPPAKPRAGRHRQ